jgi:hypothetical protein
LNSASWNPATALGGLNDPSYPIHCPEVIAVPWTGTVIGDTPPVATFDVWIRADMIGDELPI